MSPTSFTFSVEEQNQQIKREKDSKANYVA